MNQNYKEENYRRNIYPGLEVEIKQNRYSDNTIPGIVKEILTKSPEHPYGIKVKLEDGNIGRVNKIISGHKQSRDPEHLKKLSQLSSDELINLIKSEESEILEFKSSLKWDLKTNQANKELAREIMRATVAFLNNKNPDKILLIGIDDDHNIMGIEKDLKSWCQGKRDVFEQTLANLICKYIGAEFNDFIHVEYQKIENKIICILRLEFSPYEPVFFKSNNGYEFWLRIKNRKKLLDHKEAAKYINRTWKL